MNQRIDIAESHSAPIKILRVAGRYPYRPVVLRSENISTSVDQMEDGTVRIRLDDGSCPDGWLEITAALLPPHK